jgi:hypothetical protein
MPHSLFNSGTTSVNFLCILEGKLDNLSIVIIGFKIKNELLYYYNRICIETGSSICALKARGCVEKLLCKLQGKVTRPVTLALQPTSHELQGAIGSMVYAEIKDFKKSLTSLLTNNEQFKADVLESIRTSVFELSNEISTAKESHSCDLSCIRCDQTLVSNRIICLKTELDKLSNRSLGCELQLQKQCLEIQSDRGTNKSLKHFGDLIQDRERCNNIIIHGFDLAANEDITTPNEVKRFLELNLSVKPRILMTEVKKSKLTGNEYILKLKTKIDKAIIFKQRHKLSFMDDLSKDERMIRRMRITKTKLEKATKPILRNEEAANLEDNGLRMMSIEKGNEDELSDKKHDSLDDSTTAAISSIGSHPTPNAKPLYIELFNKDDTVNSICKSLHYTIQQRRNRTEYIGLVGRIAARKRVEVRTTCTCKKKEDVKDFSHYIETKFSNSNQVGWLPNRLKDARHDLKRHCIGKNNIKP